MNLRASVCKQSSWAVQDKRDDVKAGVKSTALLFASWIKEILFLFSVLFVSALAYVGVRNSQGPAYFVISVGGTAIHLVWQLKTLKVDVPEDCWAKFVVCE